MLVYNITNDPIRIAGHGYRAKGEAFDLSEVEAERLKNDPRFSLTAPPTEVDGGMIDGSQVLILGNDERELVSKPKSKPNKEATE